jgi:hypothetical protein
MPKKHPALASASSIQHPVTSITCSLFLYIRYMKSGQKLFILPIVLIFSMFGCKKDNMFLPDLEGSLVGYVYTFDEFANSLEDNSGVQIIALGNNHYRASTDKAGRFEFKNLPAGTYELQIEKAGFGTMKQFGIKHLGGQPTILGLNPASGYPATAFFIYRMPTAKILELKIENDTVYGSFSFTGPQPASVGLLLYFSTIQNFQVSESKNVITISLENRNGQYMYKLYGMDEFHKGDVIFSKGFIYSKHYSVQIFQEFMLQGIDTYYDFDGNQTVYPNLGDESEEFSFVLEK